MLKVWNMVLVDPDLLPVPSSAPSSPARGSSPRSTPSASRRSGPSSWASSPPSLVGRGGPARHRACRCCAPSTRWRATSRREAIFLFNNLLLVGLAFAVFWGTIFPILSEAVRGERITVGQGYYDQVAMPIGIALLVLTGVGPLIAWRKASPAAAAPALPMAPPRRAAGSATPLLAAHGPRAERAAGAGRRGGRRLRDRLHRGRALARPAGAPRAGGRLVAGGLRQHGRPQPPPLRGLRSSTWASSCCSSAWPGSRAFATEGDIALADRATGRRWPATRFVNEGSTAARRRPQDERPACASASSAAATAWPPSRPGTNLFRADGTRASEVAIDSRPGARPLRRPDPAHARTARRASRCSSTRWCSGSGSPASWWRSAACSPPGRARPRRAASRPGAPPAVPARRGRERPGEQGVLAGRPDRGGGPGGGLRRWPGRSCARARGTPRPRSGGRAAPGDRRRTSTARSTAIREIEMDHRAGNLSDEDFAALDRAERARAVELMRRRDREGG